MATKTFTVEVATPSGVVTFPLPSIPKDLKQLKEMLQLDKQKTVQLIFAGGKKPKEGDPVPFDEHGRAKCRLFGGTLAAADTLNIPPSEPTVTTEGLSPTVKEGATADTSFEVSSQGESTLLNYVLIKGLCKDASAEVKLPILPGTTFKDIKQAFVSSGACVVSDIRGIKLLGKGGKSPADDDLVPTIAIMTLRAMRSERGHDELESKADLEEISRRIQSAEKVLPQIFNRLFDRETCIVESKRIQAEMEDAIRWLDGRSDELLKRAQTILRRLSES